MRTISKFHACLTLINKILRHHYILHVALLCGVGSARLQISQYSRHHIPRMIIMPNARTFKSHCKCVSVKHSCVSFAYVISWKYCALTIWFFSKYVQIISMEFSVWISNKRFRLKSKNPIHFTLSMIWNLNFHQFAMKTQQCCILHIQWISQSASAKAILNWQSIESKAATRTKTSHSIWVD